MFAFQSSFKSWRYNIIYPCSNKISYYIYELVPPNWHSLWNPNSFTAFPCKTDYFKNSFLYECHKWLKQTRLQNCQFYFLSKIQKCLINFIRPLGDKIFNIHNDHFGKWKKEQKFINLDICEVSGQST